jgi:hypothetical protein
MITREKKSPNSGKRLQKFFLYLIIANFILVGLYIRYAHEMAFTINILLTCLLIIYNLLLCQLVSRRARRSQDAYIIYPVVCVSILLCAVVLFRFIISP